MKQLDNFEISLIRTSLELRKRFEYLDEDKEKFYRVKELQQKFDNEIN